MVKRHVLRVEPRSGLVQISPGKVDHDVLYGLDFVLDEARIHGFKVIISLVDNWKYPGGVDEYVDWSKSAPKRKQHRPADQSGDFDDQVWLGHVLGGPGSLMQWFPRVRDLDAVLVVLHTM
jgi:hypothetical protein